MYYLVHLALPAIVAFIMVLSNSPFEMNVSWFSLTTEKLIQNYIFFAAPHWIWAAISGYFDASKGTTVGGFIGLHTLLFYTLFLVVRSNESHAVNGWFIYLLGAPILITLGAFIGKYFASWHTRQKA